MAGKGRGLMGWVLVAAVVGAVIVWRTSTAPAQPEPGGAVDMALGGELYAAWCVACHGSDGRGVPDEHALAGPPIRDADVRYLDLVVRTGRMPIIEPSVGIVAEPGFDDGERASLVAWMAEEFGASGSIPQIGQEGDIAAGAELYGRHCVACHGVGGGGIAGGATEVPGLRGVDEVAVVEALRVGPFSMPRFSEAVVDDEEAEDIAAYVGTLESARTSPLGIAELDRVGIALLAVPLVVAVVAVVFVAVHAGRKRGG